MGNEVSYRAKYNMLVKTLLKLHSVDRLRDSCSSVDEGIWRPDTFSDLYAR